MPISCIIIFAAMVVLTGCSRAPIVTVTNHSSITLSNVVVSGSGFSDQVGTIAARGDKRITVHPNADTGLRVAFDAGGHHVDSGQQAYFEPAGNYLVSAIVNTDLTVAVSTRLRSPGGPSQHVAEGTPTLSNLTHSEVGGNQFETFELRVPSGRRVSVTRSWLVRDHGVATEMLRPPTWAGNSDPSGKFYGPGSKSLLCIVAPPERLLRLRLEATVFEVGPHVWLWKIKRCWQTKQLAALKRSPSPMPFVVVQSELISSYATEPDRTTEGSQPLRPATNGTSSASGNR